MKYSSRSLGNYRIEYIDSNITQTKNLISKEDWNLELKPSLHLIYALECEKQNEIQNAPIILALKKRIKALYGSDYFVVGSPLHDAIKSQVLALPSSQGGKKKVLITKI